MSKEAGSDLIYRWVDEKAVRSYVRHDAMIGRTRHWLPKQVSGLDKIYHKRGNSFAAGLGFWMDVFLPIGFAIDPARIPNQVCRIDGHQIFLLSDMIDQHKGGIPNAAGIQYQREYAIGCSLKHPDEAFVIGDVRGLAACVDHVLVRDDTSDRLMRPWCDLHSVPLRLHRSS